MSKTTTKIFKPGEDATAYCAEQNDPSNPYISYFYRKS